MRILTTEDRLEALGGIEVGTLAMVRQLVPRGHAVTLLYRSDGSLTERWRETGARLHCMRGGFAASPRVPLRSGASLAWATLAGARAAPHVVWVHRWYEATFAAATARLSRGRSVVHLNQVVPHNLSLPSMAGLAGVDRFIAVSKHTRSAWTNAGLDATRIEVVYNGVDLERFSPDRSAGPTADRRRWGVPPGAKLIAFAGRLDRSKGVGTLLDALDLLGDSYHLIIAGEPTFDADLAAVARLASLRSTTTQLGRVDAIERVYRAADVVAVPSIGPEPFGRVAAEAMACGTPVVASAVGGLTEVVGARFPEDIVAPGNPAALAAALRRAAERSRSHATERVDWVRRRFDDESAVAKVEEVFAHALADGRATVPQVRLRLRAIREAQEAASQGGGSAGSDGRSSSHP